MALNESPFSLRTLTPQIIVKGYLVETSTFVLECSRFYGGYMDNYLRKDDKVTATWIDGELKTVTGVVTHIHGDDPINPQSRKGCD